MKMIQKSMADIAVENGIVDGPFGSNLKKSDYIDDKVNGVPVLTTKNLHGDYSEDSVRYVSKEKYESLKRSTVYPGDILVAKIGSIGTCGIYPESERIALIPANLLKITVRDDICKKYVYYYIKSPFFQGKIKEISTATAQPAFNVTKFRKLPILVPSLEEQERIVARIDELFSELDKGTETLSKTKEKLGIYRQAVLQEAFNDKHNWEEYSFGDLMDVVRNGYGLKPDDCGDFRILKISAVRSLFLDFTEKRWNKTAFSQENRISENDILFTRYNGSKELVGVCTVVPKLNYEYAYPDKIIKCTPKVKSYEHSKFLAYYMSQGDARKYLRSKIKTTSGQNGIAGSDIKKAKVYLPTLEEQAKIVAKIDEKLSLCASIEQTVETALQQVEALRQSILKDAFEGRM